jgi:hypothetical protein
LLRATTPDAPHRREATQHREGEYDQPQVFVNQNRQILDANIALAYAAYDASIIGLASDGYTG